MERKQVPPRRKRQLPVDGPDNAHIMLAIVILSLIGASVIVGLIAIFGS